MSKLQHYVSQLACRDVTMHVDVHMSTAHEVTCDLVCSAYVDQPALIWSVFFCFCNGLPTRAVVRPCVRVRAAMAPELAAGAASVVGAAAAACGDAPGPHDRDAVRGGW